MENLITIGEVAGRAGVATSAVRYYERRGLLVADARVSGQRRYGVGALRRLVFIGMLQDAGLSLDDIDGLLNAGTVAEWKAIAAERLAVLSDEIDRLERARAIPARCAALPLRPSADGLQDHGRRDRPTAGAGFSLKVDKRSSTRGAWSAVVTADVDAPR